MMKIVKQMRKKARLAAVLIGLSLFPALVLQAETPEDIFKGWQGEYLSRESANARPEMDEAYGKVALEAEKLGKSYTVTQIKKFFTGIMHADFRRISLKGEVITFYDDRHPVEAHRYKAAGTIPDTYRDYEFKWHAFEAVDEAAANSQYRYILMLKIHQHQNDQPHFHLRYGGEGFEKLIEKEVGNWWPTMVKPDFDLNAYVKNINAKIMAKVLP